MHFSRSILLVSLSVFALGACASEDKQSWGTTDDIEVTNRGIPTAVKEKEAMTTLEKTAENELVEVQNDGAAREPVEDAVEQVLETAKDDAAQEAQKMAETKTNPSEIEPMELTEMVPPPSAQKSSMKEEAPKPVKDNGDLPMNAKPGECYAKVLIPAKTKTTSERVQISEEQKVLARIIPAQYKIETEEVLVKEAQKVWKSGRGPVERVNQTTGEILCLVEEPAVYKTIERRVLIAPEQPEYKMVPAAFETVTRTEVVEPASMEWRRILCETNLTPHVIRQIQSALNSKGFDAGVVDGRAGRKTLSALNQFQIRNDLASRGITYESIEALGVKLAGQ